MISAVRASVAAAEPLRQNLDKIAAALPDSEVLPLNEAERLDLPALQTALESYTQAWEKLRSMSPRVTAKVFAVDGEKARTTLQVQVQRLKQELCNQALLWLENETEKLHSEWGDALAKASMVPTSEQELIALKKYLAMIHQETAPLVARGQTVANLMTLLETYFVFAPIRVQKQAFELDCCPMKLKMALCETNGILDLAKERVRL